MPVALWNKAILLVTVAAVHVYHNSRKLYSHLHVRKCFPFISSYRLFKNNVITKMLRAIFSLLGYDMKIQWQRKNSDDQTVQTNQIIIQHILSSSVDNLLNPLYSIFNTFVVTSLHYKNTPLLIWVHWIKPIVFLFLTLLWSHLSIIKIHHCS